MVTFPIPHSSEPLYGTGGVTRAWFNFWKQLRSSDQTATQIAAAIAAHGGVAKAWVRFNGTGVVAIDDSYNVASITDNGVGDYTVNFTTPFASANYCAVVNAFLSGSTLIASFGATPTASAFRFTTVNRSAGTATDASIVMVSFFGDQ